ncbi:zinc finger CCCH-type with G patch domain-containing protein [Paramormyrops kingsleyae]|uniref:Zinc finger CCCH-type with G patch domain-containing protein n=1 Tax=Paramormyrops kingsleyae TaxID=1676925 RepID=A0A3B3SLQ3_9TELE|nr:zinc finger CCCH-type with G patch domain-containing protein [Paramormyrops kingsleyae]
MDESSLEAAIETYHAQLKQVESALGAGLDSSQESDLLKLKDDLQQLIQLTESSLVSVKKSRLLASLEEATAPQSASRVERTEVGNMDEEFAAFYSEVGGTSVECMSGSMEEPFNSQIASSSSPGHTSEVDDEDGDEDIDANADDDGDDGESLSGLKVRAPYRTSWGTLEYHNAMVVGPEYSEGSEPHVRVLYVYPTNKSMKPCPFFLENRCRFMEDCRFSHGEVVSVSELRDFQDTDLSNLQEGSSCLARHEDGIWYPAKITEIDGGYYTVKFDSLLQKDLVIEADGIIPPMREDDSPSSESDDDDPEYSAFAKVVDSNETETWAPGSTSDFGGWEAHTRGIGSKLMSKMGYEFGKGLGRNGEGRVEPVLAVVLPKGRSLDHCVETVQKKALGKGGTEASAKRRKKKAKGTGASQGRRDVFDFLNSKLGDQEQKAVDAPAPQRNSKEVYRGGKGTKRSINVRLFQTAERVAQTEREIDRLTEALGRKAGRDKAMISHLEEKLSGARRLLSQLKAQELSIQMERKKADTHKKMTEF